MCQCDCNQCRISHCYLSLPRNSYGMYRQFSSSCAIPQIPWIIWRGILSVAFWGLWIWDGISYNYWMVYFTEWTALSSALYFTGTFILAIWYQVHPARKHDARSNTIKALTYFTWINFTIQLSAPLIAAIIFWATIFNPNTSEPGQTAKTFIFHGFSAISILLDLTCFMRVKLVFLQMVFLFAYACAYSIANIAITLTGFSYGGHNYIYSVTDWINYPTKASITVFGLIFIGIPLTYCINYGFNQLKFKCIPNCNPDWKDKNSSEDVEMTGSSGMNVERAMQGTTPMTGTKKKGSYNNFGMEVATVSSKTVPISQPVISQRISSSETSSSSVSQEDDDVNVTINKNKNKNNLSDSSSSSDSEEEVYNKNHYKV